METQSPRIRKPLGDVTNIINTPKKHSVFKEITPKTTALKVPSPKRIYSGFDIDVDIGNSNLDIESYLPVIDKVDDWMITPSKKKIPSWKKKSKTKTFSKRRNDELVIKNSIWSTSSLSGIPESQITKPKQHTIQTKNIPSNGKLVTRKALTLLEENSLSPSKLKGKIWGFKSRSTILPFDDSVPDHF